MASVLKDTASETDPAPSKPAPPVPAWVLTRLAGAKSNELATKNKSLSVRSIESKDFILLSARIEEAVKLDTQRFGDVAADAYDVIAAHLNDHNCRNPIRFWNYIPDIHAAMDEGIDRYMAFNAGRHAAFVRWYGEAHFDECVATASAVGHGGRDLHIHCLASRSAGTSVGNPRQIPSYLYSRRFGPMPPCFARATILPAIGAQPASILVGGTASIRGEDSVHRGDAHRQLLETFENLATVIRTALPNVKRPLERFRDLRAYVVRESDLSEIKKMMTEAIPSLQKIEYVPADLCRRELLVEIEGIAEA